MYMYATNMLVNSLFWFWASEIAPKTVGHGNQNISKAADPAHVVCGTTTNPYLMMGSRWSDSRFVHFVHFWKVNKVNKVSPVRTRRWKGAGVSRLHDPVGRWVIDNRSQPFWPTRPPFFRRPSGDRQFSRFRRGRAGLSLRQRSQDHSRSTLCEGFRNQHRVM